jgi:transposase
MQVMDERCAGLDVHEKTVVVCVVTPDGQETRTCSTMTIDPLRLSDGLLTCSVTHVAMESIGD